MTDKKVVVVKVSINAGDRHRSLGRSILISLAKVMVPWEFLRNKLTPTAAENKSKALKVAVSLPGVHEAGLDGKEKNQLVVKGNADFDPVMLIGKLRKKVAYAEIVSVRAEKKEDKEKEKENVQYPPVVYPYAYHGVPNLQLMEISEPRPLCGIW